MSELCQHWANLADTRKRNNNRQYAVADGVLAAFAVFFMQSSSFLAHQRLLESKKGRSNARSLFQIEQIPSDPQIRNLPDPLSSMYFQKDFWALLDELKEQQRLLQFRNDLNTYSIALDGVSFFSSEKICCAKCLRREDRSGIVHYYHSGLGFFFHTSRPISNFIFGIAAFELRKFVLYSAPCQLSALLKLEVTFIAAAPGAIVSKVWNRRIKPS